MKVEFKAKKTFNAYLENLINMKTFQVDGIYESTDEEGVANLERGGLVEVIRVDLTGSVEDKKSKKGKKDGPELE